MTDNWTLVHAPASQNWPNLWDFTVDATGRQLCRVDGAVETATAPGDQLDRVATHVTHGQSAHTAAMLNSTREALTI